MGEGSSSRVVGTHDNRFESSPLSIGQFKEAPGHLRRLPRTSLPCAYGRWARSKKICEYGLRYAELFSDPLYFAVSELRRRHDTDSSGRHLGPGHMGKR